MNKWPKTLVVSIVIGIGLTGLSGLIQQSSYASCGPSQQYLDDTPSVSSPGISLYSYNTFDRGAPLHFYSTCKCVVLPGEDITACESKPLTHSWSITNTIADITIWTIPVYLLLSISTMRKKK